ncbi:MAG: signal peptidase I [Candidatus Omnitrophota bacterium]
MPRGLVSSPRSIRIGERTVRGNSLQGLIEDGQSVKILFGYYNYYPVNVGDVVIYKFAGNKAPIIKIVKAKEGDKFHLEEAEGGWHILVNNKIVRNSCNQPYLLDQSAYRMLSLYEKDYQGIIPPNAYLLLGNLVGGSSDSTRFGLVDRSNILGKVEY